MASHDLIIVGAGIIGAACADVASAEGLRVAVVEPGRIGGGVTAASMGHLVAVDGDPAELALSQYSKGLWDALPNIPAAQFSRCGTLWVARDEADAARIAPRRERLAAAGIQAEAVNAAQLHELEPELAAGLAGGLLVADEAVVYPPAVATWMVESACHRGADRFHSRAIALGDHEVTLADGTHLHGAVLLANGCHLPELLPALPLRMRKGHLVITQRYPGTIHHQLVQMAYADNLHDEADSVAFNVQPRPTGQLLIGSSREYDNTTSDVSMPMVRRMLQCAFEFLPGLRRLDAFAHLDRPASGQRGWRALHRSRARPARGVGQRRP